MLYQTLETMLYKVFKHLELGLTKMHCALFFISLLCVWIS